MESPSPQLAEPQPNADHLDIQRLPTVRRRTGLGRSTIYRLMANGSFPSAVQLTPRAVGWPKSDIDAWLEARPKAAH